ARLEELATQAQAAGDRTTALAAWQGIRTSALATRHVTIPFQDRLERANQHLAELMAGLDAESAAGAARAAPAGWYRQRLDHDEAPALGWTVLAFVGMAGWLGGAALFAWRGVDAEERLRTRVAAVSGLLVAVGLLVWLFGLHQA